MDSLHKRTLVEMDNLRGHNSERHNGLSDYVKSVLRASFLIRTTTQKKVTKKPYVFESTFVWDGARTIYLSGYHGKRDWVANIKANPVVYLHSVEGPTGFDFKAQARVIKGFDEKLPYLIMFLERWTNWSTIPRPLFKLVLGIIKANVRLRLPWWGPLFLAKRILSNMPCVEIKMVGEPALRNTGPPSLG